MIMSGVPNSKTKGSIGDVIIDQATGDTYKCVFAYSDNINEEYDWKRIDIPIKKKEVGKVVEAVETVAEEIPDTKPVSGRTNYNKPYKSNKH